MSIYRLDNLFTDQEIESWNKVVEDSQLSVDTHLGRKQGSLSYIGIKTLGIERLNSTINTLLSSSLTLSSITYAQYTRGDGEPNLPPHFDGDNNEVVVDYQLNSNISWDLGIGTELYPLQDNNAIAFNANTNIHWRPYRRFEEGEYVSMIFLRFCKSDMSGDYSHMIYSQGDKVFDEVRAYRDSLKDRTVF